MYDYLFLIYDAEMSASEGCGQSDVLYESRLQAAFARILADAPAEAKADTEAELLKRGFNPNFQPYQARPGECSLKGIDENCCPCGHHP